MDENYGSIVYDSIGDKDGILHGDPLWQPTAGVVDGALFFDGLNDYVETTFILNPSDAPFSVFAWVKTNSAGKAIISQTGTYGVIWLAIDEAGRLTTELHGSGRGATPLPPGTIMTDNAWHRVGLTWDGAYRALYVDDVEVARDATAQSITGADGGLHIGSDKVPDAASFFSGLIDDICIYDRAMVP